MIRFFAAHPVAANLLMLGLIAMGVFSLTGLRRETFPDARKAEVEITVLFPGASAAEVMETVCERIEERIEGLDGRRETRSEAREGYGRVVVEMAEGGDFTRFVADLSGEMDALKDLPERAEKPVIRRLARTDAVVSLAVTGPADPMTLKELADRVERGLRLLPEVATVTQRGFSDHQIRIEVRQELLTRHGLSLASLTESLRAQSVDLPLGTLEGSERELLVRMDEERRTPEQLGALVILADEGGAVLRLRDVAEVSRGFEDAEVELRFDGERAAILDIAKSKERDSLRVLAAVKDFVEHERARLPDGVSLHLTRDFTSIVSDRLAMLVRNGWQGLLLVFLTMWLFFSLRLAFWVAAGLPVCFMAAFFAMTQLGYSLNMITMVALLLALGLLMDDAIVIAENVASHLRRGKSALAAACDGVREVGAGVVSSFLTTVAVFAPLTALDGSIGRVLKVLPVVLIVVIAASLIEAFFILPNHLSHLKVPAEPPRFRRGFDAMIEWLRERAGNLAGLAIRMRWLTLSLALSILLICVATLASARLKFQALPSIDGNVVTAEVLLPQGTPLSRTREVVARLEAALSEVNRAHPQPAGRPLVRHVTVELGQNRDAQEVGPHAATVAVDLLAAEERTVSIDAFTADWRARSGRPADVLELRFAEPVFGPTGRPVEIRLAGLPERELARASREVLRELNTYDGIVDAKDDRRPGKPELSLRMRPEALGLGLRAAEVAEQVRSGLFGGEVQDVLVRGASQEVVVRLPGGERRAIGDLEDFRVALPQGREAPLATLARIEETRGPARLVNVNGSRTATVTAGVDTRVGNTAQILGEMREGFLPELEAAHPGLVVSYSGEVSESAQTQDSMKRALLIGLLGIFVLLSFQFRSYVEPLVVMVAIPMALIGVVIGHLLLGYPLTMPSLLGFVSLAGVVVNDSILLVSFIRQEIDAGRGVAEAAREAIRRRFRAILLTSLTTVLGLTPLLFERSLQAQVLIPLAISIVFGILASTLLVLLVIPALYAILGDLGLTRRARREA